MPLLRAGAFFKNNTSLVNSTIRYYSNVCQKVSYLKRVQVIHSQTFNESLGGRGTQKFTLNCFLKKASLYSYIRHCSTNGDPQSAFNFEKECEETLESLSEHFEEILESSDLLHPSYSAVAEADVTLAAGVLNVFLGGEEGTYVINKQTPNQQIWLSSPISGPARFDFCSEKRAWIYSHTGESLHELLNREISKKILKNGIDAGFEKCYLGASIKD